MNTIKVIRADTGEVLGTFDAAKYRAVTPNLLGMGRSNPYGKRVVRDRTKYSRKAKHKKRRGE